MIETCTSNYYTKGKAVENCLSSSVKQPNTLNLTTLRPSSHSLRTQSEDGTVREGHPQAFTTLAKVFKDLGDISGKTFQICEEAKSHVTAAGFTNIQETRIKIPIGPWSKDEKMESRVSGGCVGGACAAGIDFCVGGKSPVCYLCEFVDYGRKC